MDSDSFRQTLATTISQCYKKEPLAMKLLEGICSVNSLIGLDFVAEIQNEGAISISQCKYWCSLCKKSLIGYSLVSHLSSSSHKFTFISKVFPSLYGSLNTHDHMTANERQIFDKYVDMIIDIVGIKAMAVVSKKNEEFIIKFFNGKIEFINKLSYYDSIKAGSIPSTAAKNADLEAATDTNEVSESVPNSSNEEINVREDVANKTVAAEDVTTNSIPTTYSRQQPMDVDVSNSTPLAKSTPMFDDNGPNKLQHTHNEAGNIPDKNVRVASPIDSRIDSKKRRIEKSVSVDDMEDVVVEDEVEEEEVEMNRFKPGSKILLKSGEECEALDLMVLPTGVFLVKVETNEGNNIWIESCEFNHIVPYKNNDFRCETFKVESKVDWGDVSHLVRAMKTCEVLKLKFAASSAKARVYIPKGVHTLFLQPWDIFKTEEGIPQIRGKMNGGETQYYSLNIYEFRTESNGGLRMWKKGRRRFSSEKKYPLALHARLMTPSNLTNTFSFSVDHPLKIIISNDLKDLFRSFLQENGNEDVDMKGMRRKYNEVGGFPYSDKKQSGQKFCLYTASERSCNVSNFIRVLEKPTEILAFKSEDPKNSATMNNRDLKRSCLLRSLPGDLSIRMDRLYRSQVKASLTSMSLLTHLLDTLATNQKLFPDSNNYTHSRTQYSIQATLSLMKRLENDSFYLLMSKLHETRKSCLESCLKQGRNEIPDKLRNRLTSSLLMTYPLCLDEWDEVVHGVKNRGISGRLNYK